jgi:hypothetical protein
MGWAYFSTLTLRRKESWITGVPSYPIKVNVTYLITKTNPNILSSTVLTNSQTLNLSQIFLCCEAATPLAPVSDQFYL